VATLPSGHHGVGLGVVDLDLDGDLDLVTSAGGHTEPGPVQVWWNEGGSLDTADPWQSQDEHHHGGLGVGDVDGDGWPDVAVSVFLGPEGLGDPGGLHVYRNLAGTLESTPSWTAPNPFNSLACAWGDVDRDGDLDLAAASGEPEAGLAQTALMFSNVDGTLTQSWHAREPGHSLDVAWGDVDGDGWLDLAVAYADAPAAVYMNLDGRLDPDPGWVSPEALSGGSSLALGDVDGDGHLDLVTAEPARLGGAGTTRLWCGPELTLCWEDPTAGDVAVVGLEDVDGDGGLDLVLGPWSGPVRIHFGHEGRPGDTAGWTASESGVAQGLAWADLDGSDFQVAVAEGHGAVAVPGPVLSVTGGVAAGGWASGPGDLQVEYLAPVARDLIVAEGDPGAGDRVYGRAGATR